MIARVVLHEFAGEDGIPAGEYIKLHEAMFAINYFSIIQDDDTKKYYQLPPATYVAYNQTDLKDAILAVKTAANRTGRNNSVFVAEFSGSRWLDLKEV